MELKSIDFLRYRIACWGGSKSSWTCDVKNAMFRADIVRGLVTFHVIETTSLAKKTVELFYEALISGLKKYYKMDKLKPLSREGYGSVDNLINYNFTTRLKKVVGKLEAIGGKVRWCIYDL